ncbi:MULTISPECIES: hypothetical protein [unclassified Pseudomonas]|uniref:hypothetical protein n=1 Tax=unclassified Pseudomonas TaxID=196821 RepID=UPI0037F7A9D0
MILDPWNGAGTTSLMASIAGYDSIGVDLNPVMKVIARAKQSTSSDVQKIEQKLAKISTVRIGGVSEADPLRQWFLHAGVRAIRKVERLILDGAVHKSVADKVNSLSASDCVLYTALFNCVRGYLKDFIPSNPTWIKKPKSECDKVDVNWKKFKSRFLTIVNEMINGLHLNEHDWDERRASLLIASSEQLPLPDMSVDLVLTSPPYCTRIDYGVATMPELAIVSGLIIDESDKIRRALMGTTTVPKMADSLCHEQFGCVCAKFLDAVKSHSSKASATYYYKNFVQYFTALAKSLLEVSRVMKRGASFVCVVQDSFYKDLHCDLPGIIIELGQLYGLELQQRHDFESKQNMVNINGRSKSYRKQSTAYESVLVLAK